MDSSVIKNPVINNFLNKYDKRDWNDVLIKLCLIAIEYLKDCSIKTNFYTFDNLDDILNTIRNNHYKIIPNKLNKDDNLILLTPVQEKIVNKMTDKKMLKEPLPKVEKNKPNFSPDKTVKHTNYVSYKNQYLLKNSPHKQKYNNTFPKNTNKISLNKKPNVNVNKQHDIILPTTGNNIQFNYENEKHYIKQNQDLINKNKFKNEDIITQYNLNTEKENNIETSPPNNIDNQKIEKQNKQNNMYSNNQKYINVTEDNIKTSNIPINNNQNLLNPTFDNSINKNQNNIMNMDSNPLNQNQGNIYHNHYYYHCHPQMYIPDLNPPNLINEYNLNYGRSDEYPYLNYEYNNINLNKYNQCGDPITTYEILPPYSLEK